MINESFRVDLKRSTAGGGVWGVSGSGFAELFWRGGKKKQKPRDLLLQPTSIDVCAVQVQCAGKLKYPESQALQMIHSGGVFLVMLERLHGNVWLSWS